MLTTVLFAFETRRKRVLLSSRKQLPMFHLNIIIIEYGEVMDVIYTYIYYFVCHASCAPTPPRIRL